MVRRAVSRARALRHEATPAERRLWRILQSLGLDRWKLRRQRPIGRFVVDFACMEAKLAIEVDGGHHADNAADEARTVWLESIGWQVIRFWNADVMTNYESVAETIMAALETRKSTLTPALSRRAGEGAQRHSLRTMP